MYFFVKAQMDYLIFIEGLLFIVLGVVCYFIVIRNEEKYFSWQYLGLFGLIHGIGEWLSLLALSFKGIAFLTEVRLTMAVLASFALIEFARIGAGNQQGRRLGRWIFLPFLVFFLVGGLLGLTLTGLALKLIPLAVGSFWSAYALVGHSPEEEEIDRPLTILGLALAAHAVLDVGVLTHSNFPVSFDAVKLNSHRDIMVATQLVTNLVVGWGVFAVAAYSKLQYELEEIAKHGHGIRWRRFSIFQGVLSLLLIFGGWGLTDRAGDIAESELKENLLSQAVTAASAVNTDRIKTLSGTAVDLGSLDFKVLQAKLKEIHKANPDYRFVYLMGIKQGKVVFLVDAESESSPAFSAPGLVYKEASPGLLAAFRNGTSFVEGPITDQWGTWISGHAPVIDERGNVLALLGMDIDVGEWPVKIAAYRLTAISITLIVYLAFMFMIVIYINRQLAFSSMASEKRFRTIFDNAAEGIMIFDKDSQYLVHLNKFALEKLGYEAEEIPLLTVKDILITGSKIVEDISTAASSGLSGQVWEAKCRGKNGRLIDVQFTGTEIKLQQQTCIVLFSRDITSQKVVEEALRLRTTALESAANSIVITDRIGQVVYLNPAFTRLTGFTAAEFVERNISFLDRDAGNFEVSRQIWRTIRSGKVWNGEITDSRKDGSRYPAELTITPVFSDRGAITHFVAMIQDITSRKQAEQQLKYLATHDGLTGIPNRSFLEEALKLAVAKAKRGKHSALLLVDMDNFKLVNDTLGHAAGDDVLRGLVKVLIDNLREEDFIARLGGDEFAVLLDGIPVDGAITVSEKLRRSVFEGEGALAEYSTRFNLSLSGGLIIIDGRLDYIRLLSQADTALYASKEAGRNRITFIESGKDAVDKLNETNQLINIIKNAVKENRLIQLFQPVVSNDSGEVAFYESHVRLSGEDGELIAARVFVPVAERYGLITEIDYWAVRSAIQALQKYPDAHVFVNISRVSLGDKALLDLIESSILESSIEPARIGFEITETATVKDLVHSEHWVRKLKGLGCPLALDQFGLECSSFSYLHDLPIDFLKIDGSFVRKIEEEDSYRSLVRAMNAVAHTLGKKTVAEFVENKNIQRILQELGTDYVQGNFLGKPGPIPHRII